MVVMEDDMPEVIALWPTGTEGLGDESRQEQEFFFSEPRRHRVIRNVTQPTLMTFLPDPAVATGTAVIICPGGGHRFLAIDHEGIDVAKWLSARGVAAFVLKYRVMPTPERDDDFRQMQEASRGSDKTMVAMRQQGCVAIVDGQQAVKVVRQRAAEWNLAPDRIGIMGFSAGGHVAGGVAIDHDVASRPSFVAPIYGALWEEITVPADAPPLFSALASNDQIAVEPCLRLYTAWHAAGRSAELHIYAQGGHGFGMWQQGLPVDSWIERFSDWLRAQGLLEATAHVLGA